jgi:hypothetical protein
VVLSWTLNWISVPSLNRLPNSDELVADAANEAKRSARTHATTAHLFITPLTSVQAAQYTPQPVESCHAAAVGEEAYLCVQRRDSRPSGRVGVERLRCLHTLAEGGWGRTGIREASDLHPAETTGGKAGRAAGETQSAFGSTGDCLVIETIRKYVQRAENET